MNNFVAGMPVSIDRDGNAFPGAGTTIHRNTTARSVPRRMGNVEIRELDFNIALVAYNGGVDAFKFTWDGYAVDSNHNDFPKTVDGNDRMVDDMVRIDRERFIVVGSRELFPMTAIVTRDFEKHQESVSFTFGNPLKLDNDDDM